MSHISKIEIEIRSLEVLQRACTSLGLEFVRDQRTYTWYGRLVEPDKYPLPEGLTQNDLGKCQHAIRVPGAEYEIGVVKLGDKHILLCDYWDSRLQKRIGENGGLLRQAYAIEQTKLEARKRNFRVTERKLENGTRLILSQ